MTFTARLRKAADPIWQAQLEHPFVQGIATGELEDERMARWVRQDYLYLREFARVFAYGAAKARQLEQMSWYAKVLDLTLNTEMDLHRQYAARFGITERELEAEAMWPTTRAYTDLLVRTSAQGSLPELVAVLLPCSWGYGFVGTHLAEAYPAPKDDRHADWIAMYTSPEYREAVGWLKEEMDRLAQGATEDQLDHLEELFVLSSRYEHAFWEMCWHGEDWGLPDQAYELAGEA